MGYHSTHIAEIYLNRATISSLVQVLQESLSKDTSLAKDLLKFMQERNIQIPALSTKEMKNILPVSFKNRNNYGQQDALKSAFETMDLDENILS